MLRKADVRSVVIIKNHKFGVTAIDVASEALLHACPNADNRSFVCAMPDVVLFVRVEPNTTSNSSEYARSKIPLPCKPRRRGAGDAGKRNSTEPQAPRDGFRLLCAASNAYT